jgi:hypothetical protein
MKGRNGAAAAGVGRRCRCQPLHSACAMVRWPIERTELPDHTRRMAKKPSGGVMAGEGMEPYRRLGSAVIFPPALSRAQPVPIRARATVAPAAVLVASRSVRRCEAQDARAARQDAPAFSSPGPKILFAEVPRAATRCNHRVGRASACTAHAQEVLGKLEIDSASGT